MALTRRAGRCLAGIPAAWASFRLAGCLLLLLPGLAGALGWAAAEPWELEQGNSAEALASVVRQVGMGAETQGGQHTAGSIAQHTPPLPRPRG